MTITSYWIFLGLALCWMHAFNLLIQPKRSRSSTILIAILISLAFIQWELWLQVLGNFSNPVKHHALIYFLHQPCLYLPGPLLYIYAHSLLDPSNITSMIKRHLFPAGFILVWSMVEFILWDGQEKLSLSRWLYLFCFSSGAIYAYLLLTQLRRFAHSDNLLKIEFSLLSIIISVGVAVSIIASVGGLLNSSAFYQLYASTITLMMISAYLVGGRFPELTTTVADDILETIEKKKYEQSHLKQVDIENVTTHLTQLMTEQKQYRNENIDLAGLAADIGLNGHQLSQLLNDHLNTNFNSFIKGYRIEEAKTLLCSDNKHTITHIAFEVGFSSSSTFYKAFQDATGLAPGQFRKRHRLKNQQYTP